MVGWWLPVLVGAAVLLTVLAAFPPWSDSLVADLGTSPWWVVAPAATVAVLLVLGVESGGWAVVATFLGGVTTGLGVLAFVRSAGDEPGAWASLAELLAGPEPYSAAPLAAAFAALVATVAGGVLAFRRRAWLDTPRPADLRRGFRRLVALSVVGAVLGTGLHLGASLGAERVGAALTEEGHSPVDAVSEPVPEADRPLGTEMRYSTIDDIPPGEPGEVAWQATLPGETELSVCPLAEPDGWDPVPVQSTLVTVEDVADGDAVVGYDAEDGTERWRYTVHAREGDPVHRHPGSPGAWPSTVRTDGESRLGQVAVAAPCTVLIVVDPYSVVALDAATGDVRNVATLPVNPQGWFPHYDPEESRLHWRFPTASIPDQGESETGGRDAPRLVSLDASDVAYLAGPSGLVELDRQDGTPRGLSHSGDRTGCKYLVDYGASPWVLVQGCVAPVIVKPEFAPSALDLDLDDQAIPDGELADLHGVLSHDHISVPHLGCAYPPRISDLIAGRDSALVVGTWCEEEHEGPMMLPSVSVNGLFVDDPVRLPAETELPTHPQARSGWAWLDQDGDLTSLDNHRKQDGAPFYSPDEPLAAVVWPGYEPSDDGWPFYGVTESGNLLGLRFDAGESVIIRPEQMPVTPTGSTDVAAAPCSGERDVVFDPVHEHVLVFCRMADETTVTAVADGPGFVPASEE